MVLVLGIGCSDVHQPSTPFWAVQLRCESIPLSCHGETNVL